MPILINEVHTNVIDDETDEQDAVEQQQPEVTGVPAKWLEIQQLLQERRARLEDD